MSIQTAGVLRECQAESLESGSRRVPRIVDLLERSIEQFRRTGVVGTLRKIAQYLQPPSNRVVLPASSPGLRALPIEEEILNLLPGEMVEVKSVRDIHTTLDEGGKLHGLAFLPGMEAFCGQRFQVYKRMQTLYQEESGEVRRLKHTVLLSGVQCDGLLMKCDRSCYYYWREAWLRRVSDNSNTPRSRS